MPTFLIQVNVHLYICDTSIVVEMPHVTGQASGLLKRLSSPCCVCGPPHYAEGRTIECMSVTLHVFCNLLHTRMWTTCSALPLVLHYCKRMRQSLICIYHLGECNACFTRELEHIRNNYYILCSEHSMQVRKMFVI